MINCRVLKQLLHSKQTEKCVQKTNENSLKSLIFTIWCSADFCKLTNLMDSLSHWVESESAILTGSKYISSTESAMAKTLRP